METILNEQKKPKADEKVSGPKNDDVLKSSLPRTLGCLKTASLPAAFLILSSIVCWITGKEDPNDTKFPKGSKSRDGFSSPLENDLDPVSKQRLNKIFDLLTKIVKNSDYFAGSKELLLADEELFKTAIYNHLITIAHVEYQTSGIDVTIDEIPVLSLIQSSLRNITGDPLSSSDGDLEIQVETARHILYKYADFIVTLPEDVMPLREAGYFSNGERFTDGEKFREFLKTASSSKVRQIANTSIYQSLSNGTGDKLISAILFTEELGKHLTRSSDVLSNDNRIPFKLISENRSNFARSIGLFEKLDKKQDPIELGFRELTLNGGINSPIPVALAHVSYSGGGNKPYTSYIQSTLNLMIYLDGKDKKLQITVDGGWGKSTKDLLLSYGINVPEDMFSDPSTMQQVCNDLNLKWNKEYEKRYLDAFYSVKLALNNFQEADNLRKEGKATDYEKVSFEIYEKLKGLFLLENQYDQASGISVMMLADALRRTALEHPIGKTRYERADKSFDNFILRRDTEIFKLLDPQVFKKYFGDQEGSNYSTFVKYLLENELVGSNVRFRLRSDISLFQKEDYFAYIIYRGTQDQFRRAVVAQDGSSFLLLKLGRNETKASIVIDKKINNNKE